MLLVVSSEGRLDAAGKHQRPGFEMDELAQAWLVLRANGLRVEVASPAGGSPVADQYDVADDSIRAFNADPQAVAALKATRRTQDVSPGEHAAILVIGGKGAMFDLPRDTALACWRRPKTEPLGVLLPLQRRCVRRWARRSSERGTLRRWQAPQAGMQSVDSQELKRHVATQAWMYPHQGYPGPLHSSAWRAFRQLRQGVAP